MSWPRRMRQCRSEPITIAGLGTVEPGQVVTLTRKYEFYVLAGWFLPAEAPVGPGEPTPKADVVPVAEVDDETEDDEGEDRWSD